MDTSIVEKIDDMNGLFMHNQGLLAEDFVSSKIDVGSPLEISKYIES